MANKEYRPEKWPGQPDWCPNCLGHQDGQCSKCVASFEAGASAMLAARDKWWIEQVENLMKETTLRPLDITYSNYLIVKWEQFKQSLEAKQ